MVVLAAQSKFINFSGLVIDRPEGMAKPLSQTVHDPDQLQQLIGRPLVPFFFGDGAINEGLELDET